MDPFTALSVAGNVLQFVDFAFKLVSDSRAIYKSSKGVSADHDVLETIADDVYRLSDRLTEGAYDELNRIVRHSKDLAHEILSTLEELKAKSSPGKIESFVQALKEMQRKDRLQKLAGKLDKLQGQLRTHLIATMSDQQSQIFRELKRIEEENARMEMDRANAYTNLRSEVLSALQFLIPDTVLQSRTVRDHLTSLRNVRPVFEEDVTQLSEQMEKLSSKISELVFEGRKVASEQTLLRSLCYRSMKARFTSVSDAFTNTFQWIFEESSQGQDTGLSFLHWLTEGNGIFWIMGKPGSGKSTLMKFIWNHERTEEALLRWAIPKKLVTAKYFFWNAGTKLQKSQEGLLQSLLYEILRKCPDLISIVCSRMDEYAFHRDESEPWTISELLRAFDQLKEQRDLPARFCFFIDGLDEYDGEHSGLTEVLKRLIASSDIKISASSRPWYVFKDAFGQTPDRTLVLEDLTANDIKLYVNTSFSENKRFSDLRQKDERYEELIYEIVEKAQGVFLWVVLIVRSLLRGFTYADRIVDLQKRLQLLPATLEDYFKHMLNQVEEEIYQEQTARIFLVSLYATEVPLIALSFLNEVPQYAFQIKIRPFSQDEIESRHDDMQRCLDGWCKGLLEVSKNNSAPGVRDWGSFFDVKATFMHRTVRDFLQTKDMQTLLKERTQPYFDPRISLCNALLAQLKSVPLSHRSAFNDDQSPFEDLFEDIAYQARDLEIESGVPQTLLLDEVEHVLRNHPIGWKWRRKQNMFLGLAIENDLQLYVTNKLTTQPLLPSNKGRPLLDFALDPSRTKYGPRRVNQDIIEVLLQNGANPNQAYKGATIWLKFALSIYLTQAPADSKTLHEVVSKLLSHGADPSGWVVVGQKVVLARRSTGKASDLYKKDGAVPETKSVRQILIEKFGRTEAFSLLENASPPTQSSSKGIINWLVLRFSS
ncbi:hypothetical protein MMC27_008882 [Xylographa pallens]|nr:hypothetical protein [Xylographa pallens]